MQSSRKRIALLGATSHIAKNLIHQNELAHYWEIELFSRNSQGAFETLKQAFPSDHYLVKDLAEWGRGHQPFDAVINCVGLGTPNKLRDSGTSIFSLTEYIDNTILEYLKEHITTKYVNFSSGAVYGTDLTRPLEPGQAAEIELSPMKVADFYRISKIHQEAKHRAHEDLSILDIRLFSFFSRFADPMGGYFMNDVVESLRSGRALVTGTNDMFRDYISPYDLYNLINLAIQGAWSNMAVDAYSLSRLSKFELLDLLHAEFGLEVAKTNNLSLSPTGSKNHYYSVNSSPADLLAYRPSKTSWETIADELVAMGFERKRTLHQ